MVIRGRNAALVTLVIAALSAAACTATRERRGAPERSGFLGDYSQLKENPEYKAALVYVREDAPWSRYDSVHIDSVTLWANEDTADIGEEDRQLLTDIVYRALYDAVGKYFIIVGRPGPTTLRLRAALTQADGAMIGLRTITTVVPQLRILTALGGLSADTAATVGEATVEMELLDSITNERLAAGVDRRAGNKAIFAARSYSTWGDVEAAAQLWANRIAWQLARHGVQRKAGVEMPEEPSESRSF